MSCYVTCTITFILTTVIPIKLTYDALNKVALGQQQKKWAVFWAIAILLLLIESYLPFLKFAPLYLLKVLFLVWLYHPEFNGSLLLNQVLQNRLAALPLDQHLSHPQLSVFQLLENKEKTQ